VSLPDFPMKYSKIMRRKMKKSAAIILGFIIFVYLYPLANAYVLLGPHILDLMRKELGNADRLFVSQKLFLFSDSLYEGPIELNEKLMYVFPDTFRSDMFTEDTQRIHVLSKGRSVTVIDGKITADRETELDRYKDIILCNSRELLEEKLPLFGVDVSISSLGRFQGRLAFVLGAQYPDTSVPQLWVDKNTFKPFRWIVLGRATENQADLLEFRYFEWRQVDKIWYPMRIELYQGENLVRMIAVDEIKVNAHFPPRLFDIQYLKSLYPPATPVLPEQGESNGPSDLQKALDEFKKIVE
jgi:outer membrane lipoprotein-sorting protein